MDKSDALLETPWDSLVLGVPTYEFRTVDEQSLALAASMPGHFTVKIDPLSSKELLHRHRFYYCDTLIEPYCTVERFCPVTHEGVKIVSKIAVEELLTMQWSVFPWSFPPGFQDPENSGRHPL